MSVFTCESKKRVPKLFLDGRFDSFFLLQRQQKHQLLTDMGDVKNGLYA